QLDAKKTDLEGAELALHQFKKDHDVLSLALEDKQNIVASSLEKYNADLADSRKTQIEVQARLDQLRAALVADPLEAGSSAISSSPTVTTLRNKYREKASEAQALEVRYGGAHPEMLAAKRELDSLRVQIRGEIEVMIRSAEADLREARQTEVGLRREIDKMQDAGHRLNQQEIKYNALERQKANQANLYGMLLERTTTTDLMHLFEVVPVQILDRALKPTSPVSPKVTLNVAAGIMMGLLLGLGMALLVARMDRTIQSFEDVEALGVTVLGVLPTIESEDGAARQPRLRLAKKKKGKAPPTETSPRDLIVHTRPRSTFAESCRTVRTNLLFKAAQGSLKTLAITSAGPLEGKTTVAVSLAVSIAQSGKRVLLVDTDLRRPRLHRIFGVGTDVGMTSVLVGEATVEDVAKATEVPGLSLIPCGPVPPNPSELLHGANFDNFLKEASARYDRVVFDSPPLGAVTDAAVIAPQVDGTVVVVRANRTRRDSARGTLRRLTDVGANIFGAVVNDALPNDNRYGYGGYYYYGGHRYGYGEGESGEDERAAAE
ncbi:MAG: polysaccharide biosynthesis tyrosine autokinase, partial [Myxococcales bacterium]|nr:polysaccharide biosynthesis tyrosine autokinase [Myxococcales bacterium]